MTNADARQRFAGSIRRRTRSVQTIQVGNGPAGVAVGGGFVWVANSLDGTVSKIDPANDGTRRRHDPGRKRARRGVAFGGTARLGRELERPDADADRPALGDAPLPTIPVGAGADGIAVGDGSVWVTSERRQQRHADRPRTGSGAASRSSVGNGPSAIAVGPGAVWVANSLDGTVSRIDPNASAVATVIPVGDGPGRHRESRTSGLGQQRARRHALADRPGPQRGRRRRSRPGTGPRASRSAGDALYVAVRAVRRSPTAAAR